MDINPKRYPLVVISSLIWLIFVLLVYYYAHKPLSDELVENSGAALLDSATVFVLTLVAGGGGRRLLQPFSDIITTLSRSERLGIEALVGFGVLALLVLCVGLFNLSLPSIAALLILCTVLTWRPIYEWARDIITWRQGWRFNGIWMQGLALFIGINLVLASILALTPPTAFDTLTYHLVGPRLWLAEGQFVSLPDNHFFAFPALVHTLYSAQMALTLEQLTGAAFLQMVIALLGMMVFCGYATRQFSAAVGLASAAFFLVATSFWLFLSWSYVDMVVMAFSVVAVVALLEWRKDFQPQWLMLAGVFVGLTMSSKYNAVAFAVIAGLFVVNYSWSQGSGAVLRNGAILTVIALVVLAPWLLRTWAFYENPVYPFGPTTGQWDALSNEFYFPDNTDFVSRRWWIMAFLPLTLTVLGIGGTDLFDATVGPFYLLLIPFLLLTWQTFDTKHRKLIQAILFVVGPGIVLWLLMSLQSFFALQVRLVIYLFPWLTVLAALSFERLQQLPEKPINLAFIVRSAVAIVLILTLIDHLAGTRQPENSITIEGTTTLSHFVESRALDYLLGVIDETTYLEHNLGWYVRAMQNVNELEDNAHVLFLWETRSLYCEEPRLMCEEDTILMRWWHDRRAIADGSAAAIIDHWRDRGVDYVLVRESGRRFEFDGNNLITEADKTEWEVASALLPVVWQGEDNYTLHALPSENSSTTE